MTDYRQIIDKYYPAGSRLRDIYISHCSQVAALALEINSRLTEPLDAAAVESAAMLHDIGIFLCNAPSIECHGTHPYIAHGILGAALLREDGADEQIARVAERHTGSGLSRKEIIEGAMPLPQRDYLPETKLERLICYADKFYSKSGDMKRKPFDAVRKSMARFGADSLARFDALAREFPLRKP